MFVFIISYFDKELMFKVERMTDEASKKKRAVESEIMDTTSLQVGKTIFGRLISKTGFLPG